MYRGIMFRRRGSAILGPNPVSGKLLPCFRRDDQDIDVPDWSIPNAGAKRWEAGCNFGSPRLSNSNNRASPSLLPSLLLSWREI